jgi:hypothetical protein
MDAHPDVAMVGGLVRFFPRAKVRGGMRRYERWLNSITSHEEIVRDFFVEHPLAHPSVTMRAEAVRRAGGYREAGWAEDYDLCFRMLMDGARFGKVQHLVLWWRDRSDRATRTQYRYAGTEFRRCKVHYLKEIHLGERTRVQIWGAGKEGRALGKHIKRAGLEVVRYIDIAPTKIGKRLLGAPIQATDSLTRDTYLLVAVGAEEARGLIRAELAKLGWSEPEDYRTMV